MHEKSARSAAAAIVATVLVSLLAPAPRAARAMQPSQPPPPAAAAPATPPGQTAAAADPVALGDAAWNRRAEGHQGPHAAPGPIGEAIAAYERALEAQPGRLEACWKLLRALHFKGQFVARTKDEKQAIFDRGRQLAEGALDRLARRAGGRERLDKMSPAEVAKAYAGVPEAVALHLWGGIHWGLWGDVFGRLAAARQGVGDRIRRYSEVVIVLDERYESAGGHRLLGRLHTLAPKIPLISGWVDRGKAVAELRRAAALAADYPLNQVFLADALLRFQPEHAAEAREILRRQIARPPSSDQPVEDEDAIAQAKAILAGHIA
jgi:tetratricopeptide (TPR) repeat protein